MGNTTSLPALSEKENLQSSKSKSVQNNTGQLKQEMPLSAEERKKRKKQQWFTWAYREAIRTDFLETREEIQHYMAALYSAAMWGESTR